jgi:formylglycine-generating enzyme required for sulfatase activity
MKHVLSETPQHRVRISKPFYIGYHEVTIPQFSRFCAAAEYTSEPQITGKGGTGIEVGRETPRKSEFNWAKPGYEVTKDHPVTNITWVDAERFCAWLSKKDGKTYRLPTEAEWEYSCRAGTTTSWSFGNDIGKETKARDYMHFHMPFKLSGPFSNPATPKAVATKRANEFGLYDMHGNVSEMCADFWDQGYYETLKEGLATDPTGPAADPGQGRIVRGGSFLDTPATLRSAYRKGVDPTLGFATIGFRVVCEVTLPAE